MARTRSGAVGLLHDPIMNAIPTSTAPRRGRYWTERGYPEEIVRATESHGYGFVNDVKLSTPMEKMYAVDELTDLSLPALMRPSKSLLTL